MRVGKNTSRLITINRYKVNATLIKCNNGAYVDGIYQRGVEEATEIKVNIQPATDDDRENLPENSNIDEAIRVYIQSIDRDLVRPLRLGSAINTNGDIIVINNIRYEVYSVDNRSLNNHIKALCMRQDSQDG